MKDSGKFRFSEWLRSSTRLVFVAFLVIAAYFLFTEHKAHLYGILPYALLALSLLLYWLMRNGQGKDGK